MKASNRSSPQGKVTDSEMEIFIARQPIFSPDGMLFGYEFLYRGNAENQYDPGIDGSAATRYLLSNLSTEFGLDALTSGTRAFVNFTRELLDAGCPYLFTPKDFVIEILEGMKGDQALLRQLCALKNQGYILALDDYTGEADQDGIAQYADILKVDFRLTSHKEQAWIAQRFSKEKRLLAEKIETLEEFELAKKNGYSLFQGYYFSRPIILSKKVVELASATYSRLWKEIHRPEPDFDTLVQIIRVDVNLSYKLLKRVNAAAFFRGNHIRTIKDALVHMGLDEVRRWTLSILMRDLTSDMGNEPAKRSLVRALFSEGLAVESGLRELQEDAFMVGLFSTIDMILGEGIEDLLRNMNISKQALDALLNGAGPLGGIIRYVRNYEVGNWKSLPALSRQWGLAEYSASSLYLHAIEQAESIFGTGGAEPGTPTVSALTGLDKH